MHRCIKTLALLCICPFELFGALYINISSVVELKRWWVLKSKIIGQELIYSKEIFSKKLVNELRFVKKCQNCTFKVNFLRQKINRFFSKQNSFKSMNLGTDTTLYVYLCI